MRCSENEEAAGSSPPTSSTSSLPFLLGCPIFLSSLFLFRSSFFLLLSAAQHPPPSRSHHPPFFHPAPFLSVPAFFTPFCPPPAPRATHPVCSANFHRGHPPPSGRRQLALAHTLYFLLACPPPDPLQPRGSLDRGAVISCAFSIPFPVGRLHEKRARTERALLPSLLFSILSASHFRLSFLSFSFLFLSIFFFFFPFALSLSFPNSPSHPPFSPAFSFFACFLFRMPSAPPPTPRPTRRFTPSICDTLQPPSTRSYGVLLLSGLHTAFSIVRRDEHPPPPPTLAPHNPTHPTPNRLFYIAHDDAENSSHGHGSTEKSERDSSRTRGIHRSKLYINTNTFPLERAHPRIFYQLVVRA